ncbi:hypothetical protein [Microbacterium yannicii]|uniref:hypothetical protein n=1 Tax=Microbacterium yannicii TaxID=671622 RepID=UPI0003189FD5|nr:hypothetical protein [Microbacterium yannicii]
MEQPTYLRRLLNQKVLLIIGFVVAIAAGLVAGFTIEDGEITPRADRTYLASSTVLLTPPQSNLFQTQIPGTTTALPQPDPNNPAAQQEVVVQEPIPIDLAESAILLAYMASSDAVADAVQDRIGEFETGEAITAVRRTTQPAGDEQFGGRLALPIIDIAGVAFSAERAEEIAAEATTVFGEMIAAQQNEWGVADDIRLTLDELNAPIAGEPEGGNPAIPVIVVAVGVFLLFIALALVIEAVRDRRRRRGTDSGTDDGDQASPDDQVTEPDADTSRTHDFEAVPEEEKVLVGAGSGSPSGETVARTEAAAGASRRRSRTADAPQADEDFDALLRRDDADSPRA